MQIDGHRVLYNSASVALGTGMFCVILLSMAGYYLISNSFRRDITSRTAFVLAATPVTNTEYIVGKFFGNFLYLGAVMLACMASAMVMFLIRGESALEPFVFISIYAWLVLPALAFVSAAAITFESLPLLSGRFGDVIYFFVWGALLGLPTALAENNADPGFLGVLDTMGFSSMIHQLQDQFHTKSMSIGSSSFDASRAPMLFSGIVLSWKVIAVRLSALFLPVVSARCRAALVSPVQSHANQIFHSSIEKKYSRMA